MQSRGTTESYVMNQQAVDNNDDTDAKRPIQVACNSRPPTCGAKVAPSSSSPWGRCPYRAAGPGTGPEAYTVGSHTVMQNCLLDFVKQLLNRRVHGG